MRADRRFTNEPRSFWANVRTISQQCGYTERGTGSIKVPSLRDMTAAMARVGLGTDHLYRHGVATPLGEKLHSYFRYRAEVLNEYVEPRLMNVERAKQVFAEQRTSCKPACPLPMNKQKGDKAGPAYFTGIINMLIERHSAGVPVNYNPMELTTVTSGNAPLRTLSRRVDGAFPSPVNPIAIWEIKEYYYTTTFGSRIADGVYETQLDGMELEELEATEGITVEHILMVDSHYTWWKCGRSYLCRIVDMLHMGLVDEVLFGYEVVERLPELVQQWVATHRTR